MGLKISTTCTRYIILGAAIMRGPRSYLAHGIVRCSCRFDKHVIRIAWSCNSRVEDRIEINWHLRKLVPDQGRKGAPYLGKHWWKAVVCGSPLKDIIHCSAI
jgi:hypothetical protein